MAEAFLWQALEGPRSQEPGEVYAALQRAGETIQGSVHTEHEGDMMEGQHTHYLTAPHPEGRR